MPLRRYDPAMSAASVDRLHFTGDDEADRLLVADPLAPWANGRKQINFLTGYDVSTAAVSTAYPLETYQHLMRAKKRYDPRNLFRINHNIPPAG